MSLFALVLLVAAIALVVAAEWPQLLERAGSDARQRRRRERRKSNLRVISSESDDFARAVERDLAALPTTDEQDVRRKN